MPKVRKVPQRSCVGCQQVFPKRELVRVVRTPEGQVVLDPTGKRSGRGAYICNRVACFDSAVKGQRLQRALEVPLPDELIGQLRSIIGKAEE